jgi:hypothetical protein
MANSSTTQVPSLRGRQEGVRIIEWENHHDSQPFMKRMEADSKERIDFELQGIGIHFVRFGENSWAAYDNNPSTRPVIWLAPPSSLNASAAAAAALGYFNKVVPIMKNIPWHVSFTTPFPGPRGLDLLNACSPQEQQELISVECGKSFSLAESGCFLRRGF